MIGRIIEEVRGIISGSVSGMEGTTVKPVNGKFKNVRRNKYKVGCVY